MGKPFIDRTGNRYGNLVAITFLGKPEGKTKPVWECLCDCGNTVKVTSSNLVTGHTTSCGCAFIKSLENRRIYSEEDRAEYEVWRSVKQRTGDNPGKHHKWYVGVPMCPEWKESFQVFLRDMGKRPSSVHSIERKDLNKGYSPDNCVWATPQEQANNRRTNVFITYAGKRLTIAQWARELGIKQATLAARLRRGWDITDVINSPLNSRITDDAE